MVVAPMAKSVRLSLCMIVRDSSRTLPACLGSIAPWVDEMVVVDTGSLDDTRSIAIQHGAKVFDFPWCDSFSAARNESLRHARGDWIFWMDSDDTISPENGRALRKLVKKTLAKAPTAYIMQVHCPGPPGTTDVTAVDHVKVLRNDSRLRFEGRIHEQILPAIRRLDGTIEWTEIFVTHSGSEHSLDARRRKQERDLRLLELELDEQPNHPFVLFNLGMTYADMEKPEQAVKFLEKSMRFAAPGESHVRKIYALLTACLIQINADDKARQVLVRGQQLFPDDPELHFRRGILEQRSRNFAVAIEAYLRAIENQCERCFTSRDRGITGHKARHNLAGIYQEIGRLDNAELQWRLAIEEVATYREGWAGLVQSLLDQTKLAAVEIEIERARDAGVPEDELACLAAKLSVARGDVATAIELLNGAIEANGSTGALQLKCQLLFENFTATETVSALEELCRRTPDDPVAWHNLGTANQKAGRDGLAVHCYQKSLALRPNSATTLAQLGNAQEALSRFEAAERARFAVSQTAVGNKLSVCEK
jgi:tetratricopeptide (TPR) repeat protein